MPLKTYLLPLWKWKWLIAASVLIAAGSAYLAARGLPPVFLARTTLMVGRTLNEPNPNPNEFSLNQTLANAYASLAMRDPVGQAVQASLGLSTLPEYKAAPASNGQLIEITVTDSNPELCQAVANEVARQVILQSPTGRGSDQTQQAFIASQLDDLEAKISSTQAEITAQTASLGDLSSAAEIATRQGEIEALEARLSALQTNYANLLATTDQGAANSLEVFEPAALPIKPIGPNRLLIVLAAAAGGLLLAVGAAYLMEFMDSTFRDADEIAQSISVPIIGYIGELEHGRGGEVLTVAERPLTTTAEAFRSLRTNLEFLAVDQPLKTLLVTSAGAGDGKTSVALNLALMMSQSDKRVILVDSDLRRPSLHRALRLPNREGLSDLFRGHLELDDVLRPWRQDGLRILTSGTVPPNPTELLSSQRLGQILTGLQSKADIVVVDGPPFFVPDAWVLAARMDGVLFVVRPGYTGRTAVRASLEQAGRVNARIVGLALNRLVRPRGLYAQAGYLSEYYGTESEAQDLPAGPAGVRRWALPALWADLRRRLGPPAVVAALDPAGRAPANGSRAPANGSHGAANGSHGAAGPLPPEAECPNESDERAAPAEPGEWMRQALQLSVAKLGASSGSLIRLDDGGQPQDGVLIYAGQVHMREAAELAEVVDQGLAGWVIRKRRPTLLQNTQADQRWIQRGDAESRGRARSAVSVPLRSGRRVAAVLTLSHGDVGHFKRDDLRALTAIAQGLAANIRVSAN